MSHDDSDATAMSFIDESATAFSHQPRHGFSLFLAKRTKTIHFVRHAEGLHNQANAKAGNDGAVTFSTPGSEKYVDAKLTPRGIQQCVTAREDLLNNVNPELVVVSPFTRTLQTAHIMFGGSRIPFVVHDLARERSGKFTCDKRRSKSDIVEEVKPLYDITSDEIDFDSYGYPDEGDVYWTPTRESDESVLERAIKFVQWLASRPENEIAVVTHSSWLKHLFRAFGGNVHHKDKTSLHRTSGNAEVRSVCLALHKGFYPSGEWHHDTFVPHDTSFRRGKWSPTHQQVAELHTKLLHNDQRVDEIVATESDENETRDETKAKPLQQQDGHEATTTDETSNTKGEKENMNSTTNEVQDSTRRVSLSLLDVAHAVKMDPNGQRLLLNLQNEDMVFLNNACKAATYLSLRLPSKQETAAVHHQITKYLQTKDKYAAAASMLLKSQAFLTVHKHNRFLRPTHLVDLPRTSHNKPYIPIPEHTKQQGGAARNEMNVYPLSISHQFPLVGIAQTSNNQNESNNSEEKEPLLVGLDIVIFDAINSKLYKTEHEFLAVFQESFTPVEWDAIVSSTAPMEDFYVHWAMKEAYTKARGLGMGIDFATFEVSLDDSESSQHGNENALSSLWKYILKKQNQAAAKEDVEAEGYIPKPLCIPATVRFLQESKFSHPNKRYVFYFLPLENGQTKGCACVCVGPIQDVSVGRNQISVDVTWTSLDALMKWHGSKEDQS